MLPVRAAFLGGKDGVFNVPLQLHQLFLDGVGEGLAFAHPGDVRHGPGDLADPNGLMEPLGAGARLGGVFQSVGQFALVVHSQLYDG